MTESNYKKVTHQHYVPKVYLKSWETKVVTMREPKRPFKGIYYYEKSNLQQGEGRNKQSVLWEEHVYTVDYEQFFIIMSECPKIKEDYINKIKELLKSREVVAYYNSKPLYTKEAIGKYIYNLQDWKFVHKKDNEEASKEKNINGIKSIKSYVIENTLDKVTENKWEQRLKTFLNEMETTIPINGVNGLREINEKTVVDIYKMVIFLICRKPDFNYFGMIPKLINFIMDFADSSDDESIDEIKRQQKDAAWLTQLYQGLFDLPKGYFYNMNELAKRFQMILYKCYEDAGSFITSDTPAFAHKSSVEVINNNSIICPLTSQYLLQIANGDENSINKVDFRLANNDVIKKFNRTILNHAQKALISDKKYLGYII